MMAPNSPTVLQRVTSASVLGLLVAMFLIGTAVGGVFRVRKVEVVGTNLPVNQIVQASGVSGQNLFTVQSDAVSRRLGSLTQIVVQRVETSFPGQVTIYAALRKPFIAFQSGKSLLELDWKGTPIRQVTSTVLPVVVGQQAQPSLGPGVVEAVRYAIQDLKNAPSGSIASFRYGLTTGLVIVGRAGWKADVGSGSPQTLVNRVSTLASLLFNIRNRPDHLRFVDLRLSLPYARFANA